jgi:hypothetical protein
MLVRNKILIDSRHIRLSNEYLKRFRLSFFIEIIGAGGPAPFQEKRNSTERTE